MNRMRKPRPVWAEGSVDRKAGHIQISYGTRCTPVALVARSANKDFVVQFLTNKQFSQRLADRIFEAVCRELDRYLVYSAGPDPWAFARYHCDTAANACSIVQWSWQPKGPAASVAASRAAS